MDPGLLVHCHLRDPSSPSNLLSMDRSSGSSSSSGGNKVVLLPLNPTKKHVSGPLKFLESDEHRARALSGANKWRAMFAEEPRWKEVVGGIARFAKEDHLRVVDTQSTDEPKPVKQDIRSSTSTTASKAYPLRPAHLPRDALVDAITPRSRWDIVATGPQTPLTPTPIGNAFARGGVWEHLTPKPSPTTPIPPTPITAIPREPWSPIVPERDLEARAFYYNLKKEVNAVAIKFCANRLHGHTNFNTANDLVHATMVRPRDELHAAERVLMERIVKVKKYLNADMLEDLQRAVDEDAAVRRVHQFKSIKDIEDVNSWLSIQEKTFDFETRFDEMRNLLHLNRVRRKSKDWKIDDVAVQYAWAVKILDDTEKMLELKDDDSDTYSDEDTGYDYSNFLRSLKQEVSSTTDVTSESAFDINSLRTDTSTNLSSLVRSRENSLQKAQSRDYASPALPFRTSRASSGLALTPVTTRSSEGLSLSQADTPPLPSPCPVRPPPVPPIPPIPTTATINSTSHTRKPSKPLSINTSTPTPPLRTSSLTSPQLTPQERSFRRLGPSMTDLNHWASELRKMEVCKEEEDKEQQQQNHQHEEASSLPSKRNGDMLELPSTNPALRHSMQASIHTYSSSSDVDIDIDTNADIDILAAPTSPHTTTQHPPPYPRHARTASQRRHNMRAMLSSSSSSNLRTSLEAQDANTADALGRSHVSAQSSVSLFKGAEKREIEAWDEELRRMEGRERGRRSGGSWRSEEGGGVD